MKFRSLRAALIAAMSFAGVLVTGPNQAAAEPDRSTEIDIGPIVYESEADLVAAGAAAAEAATFDPTIVSDFDLVSRRTAILRNLAFRQLAVDSAAESLNETTVKHIEAKSERRAAATALGKLQDDLLAFAVDTYVLSDQAAADRIRGEQDAVRRSFAIGDLTEDLMQRVTAANTRLLRLIAAEADAEEQREFFRAELLIRQGDQVEAIQLLQSFEALVLIREESIKARIEVTLEGVTQDGFPTVRVGDILVNAEIGEQLELLLEAALSDGIELSGWGYRTTASQIDLRRAHCGTSEFAIFEMPSSSCSPPTARPGASQHEIGLAVDFTENGSVLTWASPGFFWLKENAEEYGFFNLPSEAWHWSTTGN